MAVGLSVGAVSVWWRWRGDADQAVPKDDVDGVLLKLIFINHPAYFVVKIMKSHNTNYQLKNALCAGNK